MIIYHPIEGDIEIPDSREEITKLIDVVSERLKDKYIPEQQAYLDVLNEGLDKLRRR
jgi:hypothetical protein